MALLKIGCVMNSISTPFSFRTAILAISFALIAPFMLWATPAQAQDSSSAPSDQVYVYWSLWTAQNDADWTYSNKGGTEVVPENGSFIGYRWGEGEGQAPRSTTNFTQVCGGASAAQGQKTVAVTIDPGTKSESTPSDVTVKCTPVANDANAQQVLEAAAEVRTAANSMVCGINGFPQTGCSFTANDNPAKVDSNSSESPAASVAPVDQEQTGGVLVPSLIAIGILAVLAVLLITLVRSRRNKGDADGPGSDSSIPPTS